MIIKSDQACGTCDNYVGAASPTDPRVGRCTGAATHGAVSRGATGRHCEVMWFCEACAVKAAGGADKILTAEAARDQINNNEHDHEWADF